MNEEQNIDASEIENPATEIAVEEEHEPSLVDKIYAGELDYKTLDPATKTTVKKAWKSGLSDRERYLADNGWSDKPFFTGKDKNGNTIEWKTADEFEQILKRPHVAKERESHLVLELRKRDAEIEKLKSMTKMNLERNLEQDEAAIDAEIARAREDLEFDNYDKALKKKETLQLNKNKIKQFSEEPVVQQPSEKDIIDKMVPEERESYLGFKSKNLWFGIDKDLSEFAGKEFQTVQYAHNMNFQQKLDYVEKRVKMAFPSKFPKQTTTYMPTTTTTTNQTVKTDSKPSESVYSNLPDRDKQKINNLIAAGKFNTKEAVMKHFGLIN